MIRSRPSQTPLQMLSRVRLRKPPAIMGAATEDAELSWMFSVRITGTRRAKKKDHKYNKNIDPNTGGKIPDKFRDPHPKGGKQGIFYPRASGIGAAARPITR